MFQIQLINILTSRKTHTAIKICCLWQKHISPYFSRREKTHFVFPSVSASRVCVCVCVCVCVQGRPPNKHFRAVTTDYEIQNLSSSGQKRSRMWIKYNKLSRSKQSAAGSLVTDAGPEQQPSMARICLPYWRFFFFFKKRR